MNALIISKIFLLNDKSLSEALLYADNYIQYSANDPFHIITELIGFPIMMDKNIYISGRYNDLMNQFLLTQHQKIYTAVKQKY